MLLDNLASMLKPKKQKLSYRLAQQIAKDILEDALEAGTPLGKEPALLKKYQVSRGLVSIPGVFFVFCTGFIIIPVKIIHIHNKWFRVETLVYK